MADPAAERRPADRDGPGDACPGSRSPSTAFQGLVPVDLTGPQSIVVIPEAANLEAVLAGTPIEPAFPPGFATPALGPDPRDRVARRSWTARVA